MGRVKKEERKERSKNWTTKDECLLVELYEKYHDVIIGKFSGPGQGQGNSAKKKEDAWKSLADEYNVSPVDHKRDLEEIITKIGNLKNLVRKYATELKKWKTGGGPKPKDPPSSILKMYDIVFGSTGDSLVGIGSGVESGGGTASSIGRDEKETNAAAATIDDPLDQDEEQYSQEFGVGQEQPLIDTQEKESVKIGGKSEAPAVGQGVSVKPNYSTVPPKKRARWEISSTSMKSSSTSDQSSSLQDLQKELLRAQIKLVNKNESLISEQRNLVKEQLQYYREKRIALRKQYPGYNTSPNLGMSPPYPQIDQQREKEPLSHSIFNAFNV